MKTVLVVESPAKAKKIQKFFKNDTVVTSSFGHIYDLPRGSISIDTDNNFKPNYQPIDGKQKIIKNLRDLSKNNRFYWLRTMTEKVTRSRGIAER